MLMKSGKTNQHILTVTKLLYFRLPMNSIVVTLNGNKGTYIFIDSVRKFQKALLHK